MRKGIVSAGNWLVDTVKSIRKYPSAGNLVSIESVAVGLGGCAHNVLVDLARMDSGLPLYAAGCIGDDANGEYVMNEIRKHGINSDYMHVCEGELTSYTDVFADMTGKTRTFFHYRGANAGLDISHIAAIETDAKIFHLGYLLLLDRLDMDDEEYGTRAARALDMLQKKGYLTSVDLVSEEGDRFRKVVLPALPYVNYLIINEIEAGSCSSQEIRKADGTYDMDALRKAAAFLLDAGVNDQVTIHFPEGGYSLKKDGGEAFVESRPVSAEKIVSTVGAGDAFCAGMLYSLHEDFSMEKALHFANASARFNLSDPTSTGGAPTIDEILKEII